MKAYEFIFEEEYDDKELKSTIKQLVDQETNKTLLNKIYQTLRSDDFLSRIKTSISSNKNTKYIEETLTQIIINANGTYDEKINFLNSFNNGFINTNELLSTKGSSINSYFVGDNLAKEIFIKTIPITSQGIGPGEYALAAFSPSIKFTGRTGGGGDLHINSNAVEVKAKGNSDWGRLHDPRKMGYNLVAIKTAFNKAGIPAASLTLHAWLRIRSSLSQKTINTLSVITAQNLFVHIDKNLQNTFAELFANSDYNSILTTWAKLSFINYKTVAKFDGILFIDSKTGNTKFVNDENVISTMKISAPQVYGSEQMAMPKIGF